MITFDHYKDISNIKWSIVKKYVPIKMDDMQWEIFFQEITDSAQKIKETLGEDAYHFFLTETTGTIQGMQRDRQCQENNTQNQKSNTLLNTIESLQKKK